VDSAWDCHGKTRNRKEINDWSQDEFDVFAAAINTLKKTGEWDSIASMHEAAGRLAHGTNIFLHWHRKYLFDLETMLQAAAGSCSVTLPWWNWALDHGEAGASNPAVWGPDRYGALNVTDPANPVRGFDLMNWTLVAPWAQPLIDQFGPGFEGFVRNFQAQRVEDGKFGLNSEFADQPLLRRMTDGIVSPLSYGALLVRLNIASENNVDIPDAFRRGAGGGAGLVADIEGNFHNGQHCAIGGFMCAFQITAPYDPVFYLHHAMVDKIWKSWQDTHLDVDGDERNWANEFPDMELPLLVCSGGAETIPSADVEVSMHMNGTQYGAVNYIERATDYECENFDKISCCMAVITDRDQWHRVARIEAGPDDVSDICSPMNPSEIVHNEQWLSSLVTIGVMTQLEVDAKMESIQSSMSFLNDEVRTLPFDYFSNATQCEKKLCMAVTTGPAEYNIQGVCSALAPQCGL
jgi:hypothetical protein